MKRIVLTGGPCAGKSTVLKVLQDEFVGQLLIVPEAATMLLSNGWPVPGRDIHWSEEWRFDFQGAIAAVIPRLESVYELKAKAEGISCLVCDRGIMDGAAYTPGGVEVFCRLYGVYQEKVLNYYEAVFHLESLAVTRPELYGKDNNSVRFESLEEARKLEYRTREAWQAHPQWHLLNHCDLEDRIKAACQIVRQILS